MQRVKASSRLLFWSKVIGQTLGLIGVFVLVQLILLFDAERINRQLPAVITGTAYAASLPTHLLSDLPQQQASTLNFTTNALSAPLVNSATASGGGALLPAMSNLVATELSLLTVWDIAVQGPATVIQGQTMTYTITVTNLGGTATSGTISVLDTLPGALGYVSGGGGGFTCSNLLLAVTCTRSTSLAAGASATIQLVATANTVASIVNVATVSGGGALLPAVSLNLNTQILAAPSFTIAKRGAATVTQGEAITYTITITNVSSTATSGTISVVDVLAAQLGYVSGSGGGFTCSNLLLVVTCTRNTSLAAGASATLELVASANSLGAIVNAATVSGGGALLPAISLDVNTNILGLPAFAIEKQGAATVTQGEAITYTITITNVGNAATSGTISVVDVLAAQLGYVSGSGGGFTCSNLLLVVTCTRNTSLAAGASATLELVASANSLGSIVNAATVSGGGALLPAISLDVNTNILGLPAFAIEKQGAATVTQGEAITYTITITNVGNAATSGTISVVDVLAAQLGYVSGSGGGFTCSNLLLVVTCTRNTSLAVGASATLELVASANSLGAIVNAATVSGGGALLPAISLDVNTNILGLPAFTIHLDGPSVATQNHPFTYTITLTNSGNVATVGEINVVDVLPLGVEYVTGSGNQGFVCADTLGTVTCSSSTSLSVGATATIHLTVNPTGVGLLSNGASLVSTEGPILFSNVINTTVDALNIVLDLPLNDGNPLNAERAKSFVVSGQSEPNITVTVGVTDVTGNLVEKLATTDSNGHFAVTFDVSLLTDGLLTVNAVATNQLGHRSGPAMATVLLDRTAPAAPVMVTPAENSQTTNPQPTLTGTGEADTVLTLMIAGQTLTTTVDGSGQWSITPARLSIGTHTPTLFSSDQVGNRSVLVTGNRFAVVTMPDIRDDPLTVYLPLVSK